MKQTFVNRVAALLPRGQARPQRKKIMHEVRTLRRELAQVGDRLAGLQESLSAVAARLDSVRIAAQRQGAAAEEISSSSADLALRLDLGLGAALSDLELIGAYKVLAYLRPDPVRLIPLIEENRNVKRFPHGVFLRLLELEEVSDTLFIPQIKQTCSPFKFRMKHGSFIFGYVWDRFISMQAALTGEYEPEIQERIRAHVRAGSVALDVGANIGCHSGYLCELVGDSGKVYAIEASPDIFTLLQLMKDENQYHQLILYNVAASASDGILSFVSSTSNLGGGQVVSLPQDVGNETQFVTARRLDDILPQDQRIDFIKIDVEGHEAAALAGAWSIIKKWRPAIIMEFAPGVLKSNGADPVGLLEGFRKLGYRVYIIGQDQEYSDPKDLVRFVEDNVPFVNLELVSSAACD